MVQRFREDGDSPGQLEVQDQEDEDMEVEEEEIDDVEKSDDDDEGKLLRSLFTGIYCTNVY